MEFSTERLQIRKLKPEDRDAFFDLMGNPKVMNPIPLPAMTEAESDAKMQEVFEFDNSKKGKQIRVVTLKEEDELLGLCMLLTNNEGDTELGYRFRECYWGKGYAKEVTEGMIAYCFNTIGVEKVTADADIRNVASLKILNRYLKEIKDIYKDGKIADKRFALFKKEWNK
ncbi:GNAT family N-acetyltransferase [Cochleicola gelatinilyticus]|uniref:N-acetyltransferase domain-containing protein n=1 Tax=Cochleicola gelatinilyticus TaxID=1763537 RepID=A0A167IH83_9FLAO|nr:GNAT family N-acetyltransferase [Cochleicola gelatinilyticus]OAB79649.1 hypothetical protein ULVI_02535 [Cochleicola gelatinilyticus]